MRRAGLLVVAVSLIVARIAESQADCFPPKDSREANTLAIFSVPLAFAAVGVPQAKAGRVEIGLELSYLPNVDSATATPTICRPGKGPENTDLLFVAPRPRIAVGLGKGVALEASWTPPIRLNGVRANLFGLALSYGSRLASNTGFVVRAHGSFGRINAPITCPDEQLTNTLSECYQGTRSDDRYRPNVVGVETMVHWTGRVQPYVGVGYNRLMPRFQVNFVNSQNSLDNRRVEVDLDRLAIFGGVRWQANQTWSLSGELYTAPSDAVTARAAIRFGL